MTDTALEGGLKMLLDPTAGEKFVEYPPNAMQFRALCRQHYESMALPKSADAYREIEAYARNFSLPDYAHPVVRYIANRMPEAFFQKDCPSEKMKIFKSIYNNVCNLVLSGHPIPEVVVKSRKKAVNPAIGAQHLSALRAHLGIRTIQETATC